MCGLLPRPEVSGGKRSDGTADSTTLPRLKPVGGPGATEEDHPNYRAAGQAAGASRGPGRAHASCVRPPAPLVTSARGRARLPAWHRRALRPRCRSGRGSLDPPSRSDWRQASGADQPLMCGDGLRPPAPVVAPAARTASDLALGDPGSRYPQAARPPLSWYMASSWARRRVRPRCRDD